VVSTQLFSIACLLLISLGSLAVAEDQLPYIPNRSGCSAIELLENPFFVDPSKSFNSGKIFQQMVEMAPENWSWGLRGYSWDTYSLEQYPIQECSFASSGGKAKDFDTMLYGEDDSGRLGVVTLIQGWVWQDSSPPASWQLFSPLSIYGKKNLSIRTWIKHRGGPYPFFKQETMHNSIIDIWMRDEFSGKNLMMDLVLYGDGMSWKDSETYHYATKVANVPEDTWSEVTLDVDSYIDLALKDAAKEGMSFDRRNLKIYQVEMLEELKYAWGELWIGSFEFTYCP
jgi:hypothetical protein